MSYTAVKDDIPVFPGVGGYNYQASGTVLKGQGVTVVSDNTVGVPTNNTSRCFGVADAASNDGNSVCIYGPGNIVNCVLTGSQAAGTRVGVVSEGYFSNIASYSSQAIVVKGTTATGIGRIIILG